MASMADASQREPAAPVGPGLHPAPSHDEPHEPRLGDRLNWLRAGVLGANDGIVSTGGLVIGVAAAHGGPSAILTAGLAGLAAGALSMAAGEYVSVSTQRDTELAMLAQERAELADEPEAELAELAGIYEAKGLTPELARQVAEQLTAHDALAAHAEAELRLDPGALTNPWRAAFASALAFTLGALVPLFVIVIVPEPAEIIVTVAAAVLALVVTGVVSARLGNAAAPRAALRNVTGGLAAMAVTFAVGSIYGGRLG